MKSFKKRWMFLLALVLFAGLQAACIDSLTGADDSDSDSDSAGSGGG